MPSVGAVAGEHPWRQPSFGQLALSGAAFLAGFTFCLLLCGSNSVFSRFLSKGSYRAEEIRVASPDGRLDAVMIREMYGGAVGGIEWRVYIVPRGLAVPSKYQNPVFGASDLTAEKLVWLQPHLLEIGYDRAAIEGFRNLWALDEVDNVGSSGEGDYFVEIRLAPSSEYSRLTPSGGFRYAEH